MFLNLNCLMGCGWVSAGRVRALGDAGQIEQPACLSQLSAAAEEMLSRKGAGRREPGSFPGGCSGSRCPSPTLLSQEPTCGS